jgi:hypothetical protein
MLYKFTTSLEIAKQISLGVFRFYELTKYIKIEDATGRSDSNECSLSFTEMECAAHPEKLPIASFNGVEFRCSSSKPDENYINQYFVFCMSTVVNADVIGDSTHVVELSEDIFDTFEMLMRPDGVHLSNSEGHKFFSHALVEYYDIHNHPTPITHERWREVYSKHSRFKYQHEYRAALFASDHVFNRIRKDPIVIAKAMFQNDVRIDFDLQLSVHSGIDADGWRYIEFDISEFSANITAEPSKISEVEIASSTLVCS